jgi:hypothetical protein
MELEALKALFNICEPLGKVEGHNPLISVDLSDNALGKPGIESCQAVLKKKTLQVIILVFIIIL